MKRRHQIMLGLAGAAGLALGARALLRRSRRIELGGRVIIVTGASSGLGLLIARHAAEQGAKLVLTARSEDDLAAAAEELRPLGAEVLAVPTDLTDEAQVQVLVARTLERFGRVDILVNNVGTIRVGPAQAMTVEDFQQVMDTNFWGQLYPTLAVLPAMRAQGFGRIANVVSVGGKVAVPHLLPYTASKFALAGLTEGLRAELARDGILVTGIYPGTIRTGGHAHAWFKGNRDAEYTWFALSDTVPGVSTSADYAARSLWKAVQDGDPEVIVGWNARLAILAHDFFPEWNAEAMSLINLALPRGEVSDGPAVQGQDLGGTVPEALTGIIPPGTRPSMA
ncbi:SDR family NAD(P)-dependent oxidoreductase [Tundrisphaera sp. TA3]|uniref:SDR family NAD(P)-dependent oxidoreductase n=1 Tax=Tundrisphaera sp. TA3 TaxID=3435775 RepID=UPI003EB9485C